MQGIPGTKDFAAMYLISFLGVETLRIIAGTARAVKLRLTEEVANAEQTFDAVVPPAFGMIAIATQAGFWIWVLSEWLPTSLYYEEAPNKSQKELGINYEGTQLFLVIGSLLVVTGFLLLMIPIVCLFAFLFAFFMKRFPASAAFHIRQSLGGVVNLISLAFAVEEDVVLNSSFQLAGSAAFALLISLFVYAFPVHLCKHVLEYYVKEFSAFLLFFTAFLLLTGVCLAWYLIYRITFLGIFSGAPRRIFKIGGSDEHFFLLMFFILNLAFTFSYYSRIYDPIGTTKPGWTDGLG